MPSEEYASATRGTLKLKGAKVKKHKKKTKDAKDAKDAKAAGLERALSADGAVAEKRRASDVDVDVGDHGDGKGERDVARRALSVEEGSLDGGEGRGQREGEVGKVGKVKVKGVEVDEEEDGRTETERRFAEAKRKRLEELLKTAKDRPELFKTHKQRVEELNSHLSKLSEHHDMPKIGPG